MSDIFLSYARENTERAALLARALKEQGYSVWWDRKILSGTSYDKVIREALAEAGCVIVLWSEYSVDSDWVKDEAAEGKDRGVLVPVLIDDVDIPLGFGRLQTTHLVDWHGEAADPEFKRLSRSVAAMLGRGGDEPSAMFQYDAKAERKRRKAAEKRQDSGQRDDRKTGQAKTGRKVLVGCALVAALGVALVVGLAVVSTMIEEPATPFTQPVGPLSSTPGSLPPPPPSSNVATIYLQYTGDSFGGCQLRLNWQIGGIAVNPTLNPQPVYNVPFGQAAFQVSGMIRCPTAGMCSAAGSGSIEIEPEATYNIFWQNSGLGTCSVALQPQFF